ncbi:MAG: TIGR01777 family oxidoreductase [Fimbriimonas sp.]|nr:TIGR01777 family oxidoreductase [Fimbriimonas sp.]
MKVLIAGGTGFIGRRLTRDLMMAGHECTVLVRSPRTPMNDRFPPGVRLTPFGERPDAVDAVVNLAGESVAGSWSKRRKDIILDSRIETTGDLIEWMKELKTPPKVLLCASAVGFYGNRGDEAITEQSGPDPDRRFLSQVCILWEQEANRARKLGARVVNLRLANVLDPTGGYLEAMSTFLKCAPVYASIAPQAFFPWISLTDAVGIIQFAMEHESVKGPVNLAAPTPVTGRDFYRALGRANRRPVLGHVPSMFVKLALGEFSEAVLASQAIIPEKILQEGYTFQNPDLGEFLARRYAEFKKHRVAPIA